MTEEEMGIFSLKMLSLMLVEQWFTTGVPSRGFMWPIVLSKGTAKHCNNTFSVPRGKKGWKHCRRGKMK